MKKYISNSLNVYNRVTSESFTHYICGNTMYAKNEILVDYDPLDKLEGVLHLHIIPFYN